MTTDASLGASTEGRPFTEIDHDATDDGGEGKRRAAGDADASMIRDDNRGSEATATALYERTWTLTFISTLEGSNPEADFLCFHYAQRLVSFAFTIIVVAVTAISVITRKNIQYTWLVGMILAWVIWGLCLLAMWWLWRDRVALEKHSGDVNAALNGIGAGTIDSVEMTAQSLGLPINRNHRQHGGDAGDASVNSHNSNRRQAQVAAESSLPILLRTTALQENAARWELVMVGCCLASLCFSISLFLGKQNCIRSVDVTPEAILDSCTGSIQFDAAFVVIYTGAAILMHIRIKIFAPILILMNLIFFAVRSITKIPGVPDLVPEIVASYALVSFSQSCLLIGVCYVRESSSRDYFETSQRLQFHTFRLSKLRNETERDIKKFCPPDAATGVTEGHGLFRITEHAVVCVFSMNHLAAWNSVRCPIDAIETTNRFIEVLDGLRIVFDFKPTKYDTVGDRYVVMDPLNLSSGEDGAVDGAQITKEVADIVQNVFGFALLAVTECNLQLVPLLDRDAFLPPGCGGEMTHATCVESNRRTPQPPLRLIASVETGRCACMYSTRTENIFVVGQCYDRALQAIKLSSVCEIDDVMETFTKCLNPEEFDTAPTSAVFSGDFEAIAQGQSHQHHNAHPQTQQPSPPQHLHDTAQRDGQHQRPQHQDINVPQTAPATGRANSAHPTTTTAASKRQSQAIAPSARTPHQQSCEVARSIIVGTSACTILCATITGTMAQSSRTNNATTGASRSTNALPSQSPTSGPAPNPLNPHSLASGDYEQTAPTEINGVRIWESPCKSFSFADLSASHTAWLNLAATARKEAKPMRHDPLSTTLMLPWVFVMLKQQESSSPSVTSPNFVNNSSGLGGAIAAPSNATEANTSATGQLASTTNRKQAINSSSTRVTKSNIAALTATDATAAANSGTRATSGTTTLMLAGSASRSKHRREDSVDHKSDGGHDDDAPGRSVVDAHATGDDFLRLGGSTTLALGKLGDSVTLDSEIVFHFLPTFHFNSPDIEREYHLWARGPLQLNLLLVSFAGCTAASVALMFICVIYATTEVDAAFTGPMPWAIVSFGCSLIGLGWSLMLFYLSRHQHRRAPISDAEIGTPETRMCLTVIFFAHAACYCATVYVSPQGSGALGNGQLLWMYALFGISMSRPMWYGPLIMWTLDLLTSGAFLIIWFIYPYRTSDIRTTHIFLFIAGAVVPFAMRYVMEAGKRAAFVTELRVWMLQEKLNDEYDSMQEALKHIAPRFIGDEIVQALRQHHICHPDAYGVMCVVLPQLAICAVIELRVSGGGGSGSSGTSGNDATIATLKKIGWAVTAILNYVESLDNDCISPLRVDGTRIVLCGGVAKKDRHEHEEGLFKIERTHAERAHQFLRCCYELIHNVIPGFALERAVEARCFLTCGPLLGGVIGTGRISFNFFGSRIATALHAFPDVAWNGTNYLVVSTSLVMMQSAVEDDALKRVKRDRDEAFVLTPTENFRNGSTNNSASMPVHTVPSSPSANRNIAQLMTPSGANHLPLEPHTPTTLRSANLNAAQNGNGGGGESGSRSRRTNNNSNNNNNNNATDRSQSNQGTRSTANAQADPLHFEPHRVQFSKAMSLRVRGYPPIGVRFALPPGVAAEPPSPIEPPITQPV